MNIYDYSVPRPDGSELKLSEYKGRVMIIVNTTWADLHAVYPFSCAVGERRSDRRGDLQEADA